MKKMTLGMGVVAAMLFVASSALAGGVNLAWNNCASEGGLANRAGACVANTGTNALVGSFVPNADINGVTGIEIVIDLIAGNGTSPIPAWWEISSLTDCRGGASPALSMNGTVNPANGICNDWAAGQSAGGLAAFDGSGTIAAANQPAHRRIKGGFAVPGAAAQDLLASQEYFAFNALINNSKSVGASACAGCTTPVCIVLNSVNVVAGTVSNDFIGAGTLANSNIATWQGVGPDCSLVPTKNATWGQVKALYH